MKWKIELNGAVIGEMDHTTLTTGMPLWCSGVCYLVEHINYGSRVVTVREHLANNGKK